jgi:uncharacterized membrane protein YbaN (DUF454 family)
VTLIRVAPERTNEEQAMIATTRTLQLVGFHPAALKAAALKTLGSLCFALGAVGIVVPLLPTTIFWLLAVTCFAKSAPELAQRLMTHPRFGAPLREFVEHGVIRRSAKIFSIGGMALSYVASVWAMEASAALAAMLATPMVLVALYLGSRREQVRA